MSEFYFTFSTVGWAQRAHADTKLTKASTKNKAKKMKRIMNIVAAVALMALSASSFGDELNAQGQLNIDSIVVGNTTYTNVLINLGTGWNVVSIGGSSTPSAANYSGTWLANYGGYSITAVLTQTGNNLSAALSSPILSSGQVFTGTLNGNTVNATKSDYTGTAASTWTMNGTTISTVQTSCTSNPGYQCVVPNGVPITFTKQ